MGGVLEEEEGVYEGGLSGWQDCTNILSHYLDSFITPVMYGRARRGKSRMASHPPYLRTAATASRAVTRSNLLHQKL